MKYLGIDYGAKRIGIATSENGILAQPLCTIENRGDKKNLLAIHNILGGTPREQYQIVVGMPHGSHLEAEIRRFGDQLGAVYFDERYSSLAAETHIRANKSKQSLDAVAAAVILQNYLNGGK